MSRVCRRGESSPHPGHPSDAATTTGLAPSKAEGCARARQPGDAFWSPAAPKPASAAEADLRQRLSHHFDLDLGCNAVIVARPFFGRLEVWPDIVIPELRIALEYDTVGRHGLEHVGPKEESDRRKDRALRAVRWEVIRIRCGKLQPLGPYDLSAASVTGRLVERIEATMAEIRGDLIVRSYLRQ